MERRRRVTVPGSSANLGPGYDAMAAAPGWADADISSLRMLLCGGAPVPDATIRRYTSRGLTFIQGYGMTETSPGALLLEQLKDVLVRQHRLMHRRERVRLDERRADDVGLTNFPTWHLLSPLEPRRLRFSGSPPDS